MRVKVKSGMKHATDWIGEEVVTVLGLSFSMERGVMYTLWSKKHQTPVKHEAGEFDLVDGEVSPHWAIELHDLGRVYIGPPEWQGDFWDLYHDGDPDADRLFHEVMNNLVG